MESHAACVQTLALLSSSSLCVLKGKRSSGLRVCLRSLFYVDPSVPHCHTQRASYALDAFAVSLEYTPSSDRSRPVFFSGQNSAVHSAIRLGFLLQSPCFPTMIIPHIQLYFEPSITIPLGACHQCLIQASSKQTHLFINPKVHSNERTGFKNHKKPICISLYLTQPFLDGLSRFHLTPSLGWVRCVPL